LDLLNALSKITQCIEQRQEYAAFKRTFRLITYFFIYKAESAAADAGGEGDTEFSNAGACKDNFLSSSNKSTFLKTAFNNSLKVCKTYEQI